MIELINDLPIDFVKAKSPTLTEQDKALALNAVWHAEKQSNSFFGEETIKALYKVHLRNDSQYLKENPDTTFVIRAYHQCELVGLAIFEYLSIEPTDILIKDIWVKPEYSHTDIGTILLSQYHLIDRDTRNVVTIPLTSNQLTKDFYLKNGFELTQDRALMAKQNLTGYRHVIYKANWQTVTKKLVKSLENGAIFFLNVHSEYISQLHAPSKHEAIKQLIFHDTETLTHFIESMNGVEFRPQGFARQFYKH